MMLHSGGNLVTTTIYKILEPNHPHIHPRNVSTSTSGANNSSTTTQSRSPPPPLPLPLALVLSYPALDFNFTSWMTPSNLRVLRAEHEKSTTSLSSLLSQQKDHFAKKSPLSVVEDVRKRRHHGQRSWAGRLLSASNGTLIGTPIPRQMTSKGPTSFRARLLSRVNEVNDLAIDTGVIAGNSPPPAGTSSGMVNGYSNGSRPNMLSFLSSSQNHPQQQQIGRAHV